MHNRNNLKSLPKEVRWYFNENRIGLESGWIKRENLKFKQIKKTSDYYKRLKDLMRSHLDGYKLHIHTAFAIYNKTLLTNFVNAQKILLSRRSSAPAIWIKKNWQTKPNSVERKRVYEHYLSLCAKCSWNEKLELPIIPVVRGTNERIAWEICNSGFAGLVTHTEGFYGKGIYFTTSCLYSLPYYYLRPYPTILICFIIPGNVRPVIEDKSEATSLQGKSFEIGYQAHYVCCLANGTPSKDEILTDCYSEIIIPQENQVVPIFLLTIDVDKLKVNIYDKFDRDISVNPEVKSNSYLEGYYESESSTVLRHALIN